MPTGRCRYHSLWPIAAARLIASTGLITKKEKSATSDNVSLCFHHVVASRSAIVAAIPEVHSHRCCN
ncbi:unnamed protein product [Cuscuta campestris]|uniref:Uncharacterized protein n=1 Tax=Cuscuta campestris TaxID=132261 RepID=A0A484MRW9_9ASTE|nr:unnamed protein product [Cuscuta campestris]